MMTPPNDEFLTPSERLNKLVARMEADGIDVSEAQAGSETPGQPQGSYASLTRLYERLTLRKQQLERELR
jgi:hypothetical protein